MKNKETKSINQLQHKKLKDFKDLTLMDDFMFGAVMENVDLLKRLIEEILNIKIEKLTCVEQQKSLKASYRSRSVRLDLLVKDDQGEIYNVEMQSFYVTSIR